LRQYGHWKSDISYTVTGALGAPFDRDASGSFAVAVACAMSSAGVAKSRNAAERK
jgi:hypothetical protein